jgi:hypothetical protein
MHANGYALLAPASGCEFLPAGDWFIAEKRASDQRPETSSRGLIFQHPAEKLDSSRPPIKTDGNVSTLHDHRNLALTVGMLQHDVELIGIGYNVEIFYLFVALGISFTSRPCVGSGILTENQYLLRHGSILRILKVICSYFILISIGCRCQPNLNSQLLSCQCFQIDIY